MTNRRAAILLAALLPVLAIGGWLAARALRPAATQGLLAESAAQRASSRPAAELAAVPPGERTRRTSPQARASSGPSEPKPAAAVTPPADAIWLTGRVVFPPGTPKGERVRVVARGKRFDGPRSSDRHTVDVEPDGSFRVAVAEGTSRAGLQIEARYVYLANELRVELPVEQGSPGSPGSIVVEPALGGRITGRVHLPLGAPPSAPGSVQLVATIGGFAGYEGYFSGRSTAEEDGRFALGGLPPGVYEVRASASGFADGSVDDVSVEAGSTAACELALTSGVRLAGRVVDPAGEPVAGVELRVEGEWMVQGTGSVSDEEGVFGFAGLHPGELTLVAQADGFLATPHALGELADGDVVEDLVLVLDRGLALAGVVRWPDGRPALGARVEAHSSEQAWTDVPHDVSAADGSFTITGLEGRDYDVVASALPVGESGAERKRRKARSREVRVRPPALGLELVLSAGTSVAGTAVDDTGAPLGRFRVVADEVGGSAFAPATRLRETFRAADGRFVLEDLWEGEWALSARAAGHGESAPVIVDVRGPVAGVQLVVPRAARVAGVVVGPTGVPVPRASVEAHTDDFTSESTEADESGAFNLELAPGGLVLTARAEGFAPSEDLALELAPAEVRDGVVLTLRGAGRITGVVLPRAGDVSGRHVQAASLDDDDSGDALTDARGRFELEDLAPGRWQLVLLPDFDRLDDLDEVDDLAFMEAFAASRIVDLAPGATLHVEIGTEPEHPIRVTGRVTRADGPAPGALVSAYRDDGGAFPHQFATRTAADGTYELAVDGPGSYVFLLTTSAGSQLSFERDVPDRASCELAFELPAGRLRGHVVDAGGNPVAAHSLYLARTDDPEDATGDHWTATGHDGAFEVADLAPGTYVLVTEGGWSEDPDAPFARVAVTGLVVPDGGVLEGVRVELPRPGTLVGVVRDAVGALVSGASIHLSTLEGIEVAWEEADEHGRFRLTDVAPGAWLVRAAGFDDESRAGEAVRVDVVEGGETEVRLRLP